MTIPAPTLLPSRIIAEQCDCAVCHDCGALQALVPVAAGQELLCSRCGNLLKRPASDWLDKATALAVAAGILFVCANIYTFMTLKLAGIEQGITILSGVMALAANDRWFLSALVLITIFILPAFEAFALLYLLIPHRLQRRLPGQIRVFRWLVQLQPWIMLDVFLLGVLVTTVKLGDSATVDAGPGMPLFFALVCVLQMAYRVMSKDSLWTWLAPDNRFTTNSSEPLYDCHACKAIVGLSIVESQGHCPRCNAEIHTRTPHSLQRTAALTAAAAILYIPANLLVIMKYDELGVNYDSTIFAGVIDLAHHGLWILALVVFVASVVVPVAKLAMLTFLVWSVHTRMHRGPRQRIKLYRLTELVGRWSMVDVYVVTLLTAAVQFGIIGAVAPGPALLPFAAVVVLTMLAAETFDPRLIWDPVDEASIAAEGEAQSATGDSANTLHSRLGAPRIEST
jgi:paraquat-inducible protein A